MNSLMAKIYFLCCALIHTSSEQIQIYPPSYLVELLLVGIRPWFFHRRGLLTLEIWWNTNGLSVAEAHRTAQPVSDELNFLMNSWYLMHRRRRRCPKIIYNKHLASMHEIWTNWWDISSKAKKKHHFLFLLTVVRRAPKPRIWRAAYIEYTYDAYASFRDFVCFCFCTRYSYYSTYVSPKIDASCQERNREQTHVSCKHQWRTGAGFPSPVKKSLNAHGILLIRT